MASGLLELGDTVGGGGGGSGTGSVTLVVTGTGLTGGPITTTGTISVVADAGLPSQTGKTGQYLTSNGTVSSWGTVAVSLATQSATILLQGQNFNPAAFTNPFPFTSANALAGSTLSFLSVANTFTAQHTGPHMFNFSSVSTGFGGTEWGQIAYEVNSNGQIVFVYGDNGNAAGAARVVPNGSGIVQLTAADVIKFYSNANTNWITYQISLTDLTPR